MMVTMMQLEFSQVLPEYSNVTLIPCTIYCGYKITGVSSKGVDVYDVN